MSEHDDAILLTPAGYQRLKAELERLSTVDRQRIAVRIRENAEQGEFSEDNTELEEIKFEQSMVEERIAELQSVLAGAQVLTAEDISSKFVGLGSVVTLHNTKSKDDLQVIVVSSPEADPDQDTISDESPLGMAVWGKEKGAKVVVDAPAGKITYEIKKIGKSVK